MPPTHLHLQPYMIKEWPLCEFIKVKFLTWTKHFLTFDEMIAESLEAMEEVVQNSKLWKF